VSAELLALADTVLQPGFEGTDVPDWLRQRLGEGLGSVLLFARNTVTPGQTRALTDALRAENPSVLIAVDEEGGDITRLEAAHGSSYPGNLALGVVDDVVATAAVGRSIGRDLAAAGIGLDYAPSADVNSNADNPVIGVRSFGADTESVARHTAAWIRGLQSAGVAACAKHFPGHGDTDVDSHFALPTVAADREELAKLALPPFRAAVEAGVRAVMVGHLLVPAYDPEHPATVSPELIRGLLREDLGFGGMVVTDAMEMHAVERRYGLVRASVMALAAGADLVCVGNDGREATLLTLRAAIVDAVESGELAGERLADAAGRVREFAEWQRGLAVEEAEHREDSRGIGLDVARRAVRISARRPVEHAGSAPFVVEFSTRATIVEAEGLPSGFSAFEGVVVGGGSQVDLTAAAGRPLVLVTRSAHRQPTIREAVEALLAHRPDAIHVELGVPGPGLGAAATVWTHGASRVCRMAAAEVIAAMVA
jgi:beta-N-acetylhexosaminidase